MSREWLNYILMIDRVLIEINEPCEEDEKGSYLRGSADKNQRFFCLCSS